MTQALPAGITPGLPPPDAQVSPKGDAYTEKEYAAMGREAGFDGATAIPLPPTPQSLVRFER